MRHNVIPLAIATSLFSASLLFVANGNTKVYAAESNDSAAQTTAVVSNEKTASDTTNQSLAPNNDNDSVSQKPEAANDNQAVDSSQTNLVADDAAANATTDHTDATAPAANTGSDSSQTTATTADSSAANKPATGDNGQTTQPVTPADNATDKPAAGDNQDGQTTPTASDAPADTIKPGDNSTALNGDKTKPAMSDLNKVNASSFAIANGINAIADLGESLIAEPINVVAYAAMIVLGIASAIPVAGIVPLIADGILIWADSLWHGFQYGWSTIRRSLVLAPSLLGAIGGPLINAANVSLVKGTDNTVDPANGADTTTPINTDPSQTDATSGTGPAETTVDSSTSKLAEAEKDLNQSVASSVATLVPMAIDAASQVVTFAAHALTELGVVLVEDILGVLSAIPVAGIAPLILDGVLITVHSGLNIGQRVLDEARRAVILGAGGLASLATVSATENN